MIRELRRKFILINMGLVTLVLLIVFTVVCVTTSSKLQRELDFALDRALQRPLDERDDLPIIGPRGEKRPLSDFATPVFSLLVDETGTVLQTGENRVSIAEDALQEAVALALSAEAPRGTLHALALAYGRREAAEGVRLAFADRTRANETLAGLAWTSLAVGAGGLLAFFGISVFLARWALKPIERSWAQQRQFVADASHELKTPLTVLLANTDILLANPERTVREQRKWVENTRAEALRMKKLVNDLLFLAKSDAARAPADLRELNLSDLVWGAVLPFEPVAFERGLTIEADIAPELMVRGDAGQLKQVAVILLDNACKYAAAGSAVTVRLRREQDHAVFSVNNRGEAIPPEALPHVFERFYRADPARVHGSGGYGLGLSIALSIAQGHRGRLHAASSAAAGTTFTLSLPLAGK